MCGSTRRRSLRVESLKWPGRPDLADGNLAWTYMVEIPERKESFAIFIGQVGEPPVPFEVWVNGAEQPRGLGAIAKALSMDMRSEDRAWLKMKLDALARARDEQGFAIPMPPDGERQWQSGVVSAFANIVQLALRAARRVRRISTSTPTPMLNALFSKKEPKAGPLGTMSWTVDISNANTDDDFVLGVKELHLPDGSRRPYSIWLAGEYPKVLDGLCKLISLDMRVVDANWIGLKLKKLLELRRTERRVLGTGAGRGTLDAISEHRRLHRDAAAASLQGARHPRRRRPRDPVGRNSGADRTRSKLIDHETAPIKGKVCGAAVPRPS